MQTYLRVKVEVNIAEPLLRGVYLRLRDGSRKWISFVYERMLNYCYLCGLVGHLEKKCILRFQDGFVDPRKNFPYGEWLKAPVPGSGNIFEVGGEDSRGDLDGVRSGFECEWVSGQS